MQVTLKHQPSYSLAIVGLAGNEKVKVEPGAMVGYSEGIAVETKSEGGLMGGLKRMVAGESFFQNTYTAPGNGGELVLAPALPGDMIVLEIAGNEFMLQSGAYIASEISVVNGCQVGRLEGILWQREPGAAQGERAG